MPHRWLRALWLGKRRRQQRLRIVRYFDCTWLSAWGEEKARVSSLSPTGCYIESRFSVPTEGAIIRDITVTLPTGRITLQGTVIDPTSGIGFAVRFIDLDTNTRDRLSGLVHGAQR
jgi:PilZ domain